MSDRLATKMKIAICNETFRDWPFEKTFRFASELGYDGIEIAPFTVAKSAFDITPAKGREICELADRYNLEIVGLHWLLAGTEGLHLTSPDKVTRQRTARYLGQLANVCQRLGGSIMVFGSPQQRNLFPGISIEQAHVLAADCLSQAVPQLIENNVTLALEPLGPEEGNFLQTADEARQLIAAINSSAVKLLLDVKAMSTESQSIPDIIYDSRESLVHFHCNDPNRRGPGMGTVQYEPIVAALRKIDYQQWLSVEVFDTTISPVELASQSIRYLRQQLAILNW